MRQSSTALKRRSRRSQCLRACLLAAALPLTALGATDNWTNSSGGTFNVGSNWSSNPTVPGAGDSADFNLNNTYAVTFNSSPTNVAFQVQQGAVTWNASSTAATYSLTGSPSVSGGSLTIGAAAPALTVSVGGTLSVDSNGSLDVLNVGNVLAHNITIGTNSTTGTTGSLIDVAAVTQSGASTLTIGAASVGSGLLQILSGGVYSTGTGLTTINPTGAIQILGGTFNQNGNITVTGGALTQAAGSFTWAGSQTMTVQSGGTVSLLGFYETPTSATINVTGAGSQLKDTGSSAILDIYNGATLSVTNGGSVDSDEGFSIASVGNGTVTVDGKGSSLTAAAAPTAGNQNGIGYVGTGSLTFSNSATGSVPAGFIIGALNGSSGTLNVQSSATLTTGRLDLADEGSSTIVATALINVTGGTLTQSGTAPLTVGDAVGGSATVTVGTGGTYTTGTGLTTINATGEINVTGGTLNANGNITVAGGLLNQSSGTFTWASSQTMTIQTSGDVRLAGAYTTPTSATINVTGAGAQLNDIGSGTADLQINNGATLSVTSGGSVHSDQYLDIASSGNGSVTVDGSGSSFSTAATGGQNYLGTTGTGSLTFSNSATGSAPGGFIIGSAGGSSGTLNVQSSAVLTTGQVDIADQGSSATGVINVTGGTLTQSGGSYLTVGQVAASGGTATVNIGNATTSGTFATGTGTTTINATGKINLIAGTFNANGNITVTGGAFTMTGGTFEWAGSQTMTIQSGGVVTLDSNFVALTNQVLDVTGAGSQLTGSGLAASFNITNGATLSVSNGGSVHSDSTLTAGNGTITIDGMGSSFSSAAPSSYGQNVIGHAGASSISFTNSATGTATNGFLIGFGANGTLSVQSSASLTSGPLDVADELANCAGVINVTGGTLTQSGTAYLTVGDSANGTGTVTVGAGGAFTTGTGLTTLNATGEINLTGGTFNANGNITVAGGLLNETSGTFTWAPSQTMSIQTGGDVRLAGGYTTPTSATINVTGSAAQLNDTGSSTANLSIVNGATLSVTNGGSVHSDQDLDIGNGSNGTVTVDGANSSLTTAAVVTNYLGAYSGTGVLTFSNGASGTLGGIDLSSFGGNGTLNVLSTATLAVGNIYLSSDLASGPGAGAINVTGGSLTQTGTAYLFVGEASGGTGTVTIGTGGTLTTGTGPTLVGATGEINLTGGTFNVNAGMTVTTGSFIQTGGSFNWAGSQTMLIQAGGNVTLLGPYATPAGATITVTGAGSLLNDTGSATADLAINNGTTLSVSNGGTVHSDQFLDIASSGNGSVTVDGNGSSFSAAAAATNGENFLGTTSTGSLTFSNSATGSAPGGFQIGSVAGSSGTLNVQSSAVLTSGPLDIADQGASATGVINVIGGTLTQSGASYLTVGHGAGSGGTATVTIGSSTTGGTFTTGAGTTSINATGNINLTAGDFNLNGGLTVTGGAFTQTGGTFAWAGSQTMTIQSGGKVTLTGTYATPTNAVINVSGAGSQFNDFTSADLEISNGATVSATSGATVHSDGFLDIASLTGSGTLTLDGVGTTLSINNALNFLGNVGAGTLTLRNSATGSSGGFIIGNNNGSSGTLNIQSSATLTSDTISMATDDNTATGTINIFGGTLTMNSDATLAIGSSSVSSAIINIGNATTSGTLSTGTGPTNIQATGKINLAGGTFNLNGGLTVTGGAFTQTGGTFTLAPSQTMAVQSGGSVSLGGSQTLYTIPTLSLTGGTTTLTAGSTAKVLVTGSLSITSPAKLDLQSNDMIVHNGTLGNTTAVGSIINEIAQGRGTSGLWTGPGITSSSSATTPSMTALGVLSGAQFLALHPGAQFEGNTVASTDVLIKYTFVGDADLSGSINATDYSLIDNGFNSQTGPTPLTGWRNGDFNYDGLINGDDYTLIDNAYNTQGSTTYAGDSAGPAEMIATDTAQIAAMSSTAVPEPTSLTLASVLTCGLLVRRRR